MSALQQIFCSVLFTLFLYIQVLYGSPPILVGKVTDSDGNPIPYVEVYPMSQEIGTTTNREGRFMLVLTTKSSNVIVIKHSAFIVKKVELDTLSSNELNVTLLPRTYHTDPIIVEGNLYARERLQLPVSHRVISLNGFHNGGNSVAERLDRMGIQIRDYGGPAGLKTIASPTGYAEHVLIMLESLPLNSPQNGVYDFSILPADLFSQGEFYLGHGSSLYGPNAIGGTLNIMLDRQHSYLRIKSGSFGERGLSGQHIMNTGPLNTAIYANQYMSLGDYRKNNDFNQRAIGIQMSLPIGKRWIGKTFLLRSNSNRGIAGSLQFLSPNARKENEDAIYLTTFRGLSKFGQSELIFGQTQSDEHFTNPDWTVDSRHKVITHRIRMVHRLNEIKSMRHTISLDLVGNQVDSDDAGDHDEFIGSMGFLSQIRIGRNVTLSPSIRADWNSRNSDIVTTGSTAILWNRERTVIHSLSANVGTSYRYPTFNDLYWVDPWGYSAGNAELKDERGISADITIKLQPLMNKLIQIEARGYDYFTRNLIQWAPDENWVYSPQNLKKTESYGGSLILTISPETIPFIFTLGTEQNKSRVLSVGEDVDKRLLYVPAVFHWTELSYSSKIVDLNISYRFLGKRRYSYRETSFLKPYDRLDLSLVFHGPNIFGQRTVINVGARNLQDRKDLQSVYDYPEPGRSLFTRFSLEFQ